MQIKDKKTFEIKKFVIDLLIGSICNICLLEQPKGATRG